MRIREILTRRSRRTVLLPLITDWTTGWTTRDWADLPTHHPRREAAATR